MNSKKNKNNIELVLINQGGGKTNRVPYLNYAGCEAMAKYGHGYICVVYIVRKAFR